MNWKVAFSLTAAVATFVFMTDSVSRGQVSQSSARAAASGDVAMDFDQAKTTHHFKLLAEGGAIEITANDPSDVASRDAIRQHVANIATMFGQGNFNLPMLVHGQKPPGIDTMARLKGTISYTADNVPDGGRARMTTADSRGRKAGDDFRRVQTQEQQRGYSLGA